MPKTVIPTDHFKLHPSLGPCGGTVTAAGLASGPVPVTRTSEALPGSESAVDSESEGPAGGPGPEAITELEVLLVGFKFRDVLSKLAMA